MSPSPSHRHSALRDSTTNMQVSSAQSPNGAFVANEDPSSVRLDHSVWSSTDHSGWIEDSILSNIFHPRAAGPPTPPRTGSQNDQSVSHSSSAQTLNVARTRYRAATPEINPMQPDNEGVLGASDMNTLNHRVHLRGASTTVTTYGQGLRYILGHHAVNYLWMHYSAGSSVVIADAYSTYHHDGESFVRYLVDRNMPPRHATYLWTILRPEVLLETGGPARKYQPGDFSFEDDQDMSFVRSAD